MSTQCVYYKVNMSLTYMPLHHPKIKIKIDKRKEKKNKNVSVQVHYNKIHYKL